MLALGDRDSVIEDKRDGALVLDVGLRGCNGGRRRNIDQIDRRNNSQEGEICRTPKLPGTLICPAANVEWVVF